MLNGPPAPCKRAQFRGLLAWTRNPCTTANGMLSPVEAADDAGAEPPKLKPPPKLGWEAGAPKAPPVWGVAGVPNAPVPPNAPPDCAPVCIALCFSYNQGAAHHTTPQNEMHHRLQMKFHMLQQQSFMILARCKGTQSRCTSCTRKSFSTWATLT